jgi:hypothetical protein
MIIILLVIESLLILVAIRVTLIFRIRRKLIHKIYKREDWKTKNLLLNNPSFNKMIFMIEKWTFKQFYKHEEI